MNKVILLGRFTKDPEMKTVGTKNTALANFGFAVNRKQKVEGQPDADFFNCQAWGKTAELITQFFTKGQQALLVGRIQNRSWDDADGKKHYATDIIVDEFNFAGSKGESKPSGSGIDTPPADLDDDQLPFN
jgi:single-strand DNA-binding protein